MAKITPGLNAPRSISSRERIIVYHDRGRWLMRKWPRKRGNWGTLKQTGQVQWFRDTTEWIKYAIDSQYIRAMEIAEGTKLYPRDILMKAAAGNLYDIYDTDGTLLPPFKPKVEPVAWQGFRLRRTSTYALAAATFTMVPWQTADADTAGGWNVADPTWWQCPTGVTIMDFQASIHTGDTANTTIYATIRSDGPTDYAIMQFSTQAHFRLGFSTGPIAVAAGVKYGLQVYSGIARNLVNSQILHFSGTILEAS